MHSATMTAFMLVSVVHCLSVNKYLTYSFYHEFKFTVGKQEIIRRADRFKVAVSAACRLFPCTGSVFSIITPRTFLTFAQRNRNICRKFGLFETSLTCLL